MYFYTQKHTEKPTKANNISGRNEVHLYKLQNTDRKKIYSVNRNPFTYKRS